MNITKTSKAILFSLLTVACLGSCNKKTQVDIRGAVQGVWKADLTATKLEGNINNIDATQTIAFINDNESGSNGKFRQVFIGSADYESNGSTQKVDFALVVAGDWQVVDINGLKLIYNLDDLSTAVAKSTDTSKTSQAVQTMLSGNWTDNVIAEIPAATSSNLSAETEDQLKRQINTVFRNYFRELKQESESWEDVVIEGKVMTVEEDKGIFGENITFYKSTEDPTTLNKVGSTGSKGSVMPESAVAPLHKSKASTPAGLPNYDWLSTRYVDYSDLANKTGSQLRIMRNYIYARHGYRFKSADLQRYFAQYPWYTPRYSDVTSSLSKLEKDNIQTIKSFE